ncbi:hypothetical protein OSB04_021442 [Centaurea solstitialis]|uniref:Uncharacterized protein n=1 Tax=Centaurea solstitialis TaxID=347529 RepID=A0AA38WG90_9ASTR|nr:hypothetical protein OSB04_021442 [Centaurea solstitialis]
MDKFDVNGLPLDLKFKQLNINSGVSITGYPPIFHGTKTGGFWKDGTGTGTAYTGSSFLGTGSGTAGTGSGTGYPNSGYPARNGSKKLRTGTGTGLDRFSILGTGTRTTHIGSGSETGGSETVPVPKTFRCSPTVYGEGNTSSSAQTPRLLSQTMGDQTVFSNLVPWDELSGKVVMVTGASSGIGWEFCLDLAKAGCKIVAAARRVDRLVSLCDEINGTAAENIGAVAVELDVAAKGPAIEASVKKAWDAFGRIDCLINNAGVRGSRHHSTSHSGDGV